MSREWRFYLDDMIEFAELVLEYTAGYSQEQFEQDRRTYDATLRNMELIGEAATRIFLMIFVIRCKAFRGDN